MTVDINDKAENQNYFEGQLVSMARAKTKTVFEVHEPQYIGAIRITLNHKYTASI